MQQQTTSQEVQDTDAKRFTNKFDIFYGSVMKTNARKYSIHKDLECWK